MASRGLEESRSTQARRSLSGSCRGRCVADLAEFGHVAACLSMLSVLDTCPTEAKEVQLILDAICGIRVNGGHRNTPSHT